MIPALLAAWLLLTSLLATGCSTRDSRADEPRGAEAAEAAEKPAADRDGSGPDAAPADEAVPVEVTALARGEIEAVLQFSANLEAEREVQVFAEAARRVVELAVEEGDRVKKGQLLAKLQDAEQKTTLAKVRAQYDKARREYDRQKRLFGNELISEQAFNEATYELERLKLEVEQSERQLSYTEVRAPISGTVTLRRINIGDTVTLNQHLFDLVDFGSIVARIFVPEKELPRLAPGQTARVTSPALGQQAFSGRVDRISPVVDPKSGTVKVTVALPESGALRPGMYVDVQLVTAVHAEALLLPKRALIYDNDQIFIFRLREDGEKETAERVLVEPILEDESYIEVANGLRAGDRVVTAGQAGLKDGVPVRRIGGEPGEPAPAADSAPAPEPARASEDDA